MIIDWSGQNALAFVRGVEQAAIIAQILSHPWHRPRQFVEMIANGVALAVVEQKLAEEQSRGGIVRMRHDEAILGLDRFVKFTFLEEFNWDHES
jgi:hypothetical protein